MKKNVKKKHQKKEPENWGDAIMRHEGILSHLKMEWHELLKKHR